MKHLALIVLVVPALTGCPATNSGGDQNTAGDTVNVSDAALPGDDGGATSDAAVEPDVPCTPQCSDGVCSADGCGGDCPACGDLPAPYGTSCTISGTPDPPTSMSTVEAFPNLVFIRPIQATTAPDGTDRIFVVEKRGVIKMFANDPAVEANDLGLLLDIQGPVDASNDEGGLLGLAFHPDFVNNRFFFVNYTGKINNQLTTIVSRFTVGPDGMGDPATELILLTVAQPFGNHNGGGIAFGPDGYLYTGLGDGGSGGDPYKHGQNTSTLLGAMLRIDVDAPGAGQAYGIPADNPFADGVGGRPEIWAWGLRNPWRFSFDPLTGQLWAADVGQERFEEVVIVEGGKNYGWNTMEGSACYPPNSACDPEGLELPIVEYDHAVGKSITGGYVYRGSKFPELYGAYVYADYVSGVIFAARFEDDETAKATLIVDSNHSISSFGEDQNGELLLVDYPFFNPNEGRIHRLAPGEGAPAQSNFPLRLSDTGCFSDLSALKPAQGVISYSVNSPLWHDGARSERHFVLPQDGQFGAQTPGAWSLPDGGKLIKTFVMDRADGSEVKVETRFLLRENGEYRYYSYRWNEAQTDAELLSSDAEWTFDLNGSAFTWHYPSRSQCKTCHNPAAGHLLGWHTGQLNREHTGDGWSSEQFGAWEKLGIMAYASGTDLSLKYPAPGDVDAPIEDRTRAALQANCASCHVPNGPTTTQLDLRFETPLTEMAICNVDPDKGGGPPGAKVLTPGSPSLSTLLLRMQSLGDDRMPNLGSAVLDTTSVGLVSQWIQGITDCAGP